MMIIRPEILAQLDALRDAADAASAAADLAEDWLRSATAAAIEAKDALGRAQDSWNTAALDLQHRQGEFGAAARAAGLVITADGYAPREYAGRHEL
jgi:hypothetical protein